MLVLCGQCFVTYKFACICMAALSDLDTSENDGRRRAQLTSHTLTIYT